MIRRVAALGAAAIATGGTLAIVDAGPVGAHGVSQTIQPGEGRIGSVWEGHRGFSGCNWVRVDVRLANGNTVSRVQGAGCQGWTTSSDIVQFRVGPYQTYGTTTGWKRA